MLNPEYEECPIPDKHRPMIYRGTSFCNTRCEEFAKGVALRPVELAMLIERHKNKELFK